MYPPTRSQRHLSVAVPQQQLRDDRPGLQESLLLRHSDTAGGSGLQAGQGAGRGAVYGG